MSEEGFFSLLVVSLVYRIKYWAVIHIRLLAVASSFALRPFPLRPFHSFHENFSYNPLRHHLV